MFFAYGEKEITYLKQKDKRLAEIIDKIGMIEREVDTDLFSAVIHHIIGQQISTKAQATIWKRMNDQYGIMNADTIQSAGFLFARLWNVNQVGVYVPEQNFTLMGMAGLITGVMHAPLTGIFLIAELTGGYQLFMPLMIVCISSLLTISIFESHSIYALRLAREGKLLTHHIDKAALTLLGMQEVIEKDYHPVGPDLPMSKLVSEISRSNNNFLPVLDQAGVLLGVIDITKIRHIIFRTELYQHFTVRQLMMQPSAVLTEHDSMDEVMQKFDKTDAAQLPVVDVAGVLKGYISRTRIYSMYRQIVADMSAE